MKKLVSFFLISCQLSQALATSLIVGKSHPLESFSFRRTQSAPLMSVSLPEEVVTLEKDLESQTGGKNVSCLKSMLRLSPSLLRSSSFALGMMTVYGQSLERIDINLGEWLYPLMVGTAIFYGLVDFLGQCLKRKIPSP